VAAAIVALLAGCAVTQLKTPSGQTTMVANSLLDTVAFDHGCKAEDIVVLREYGKGALTPPTACDLNVCGQVRRYKRLGPYGESGDSGATWLDVTALYPAGSLTPPGK
jgi:hypothetical protein